MDNKEYIFFDLDGTLTEPAEGITNSVAFALEKFGITVKDKTTLQKFIGPPLIDSFVEFYGFSRENAEKAVAFYREYYKEKGIFQNKVYEGIPAILETLFEKNKKIILASSKPQLFAEQILKYFGIEKYFSLIVGATMDEKRSHKDEVLAFAIEKSGITDISSAVMIGDRKFDIEAAHKYGMDAIGVLFGYGSIEELKASGADFIAATTNELKNLLI